MLNYWMSLYEEAGNSSAAGDKHIWPERSDVQPAECRPLLSDMFILELSRGAANYRLAGTNLCSLYGRELKNEGFGEAFEGADQRSADSWAKQLGEDGMVVLICSLAEASSGDLVNLETLLLPIAHHGHNSKRVLGLTVSCENPSWLGAYPIVSQHIRSSRILHPWRDTKTATEAAPADQNILDGYFKPASNRTSVLNPPPVSPALHQHEDFKEAFSFTRRDPFLNENEINGGFAPMRKVGHLQVIEGGRED